MKDIKTSLKQNNWKCVSDTKKTMNKLLADKILHESKISEILNHPFPDFYAIVFKFCFMFTLFSCIKYSIFYFKSLNLVRYYIVI